jgi:hypothetical protein
MSEYWKQSLWLSGICAIVALMCYWSETEVGYWLQVVLSLGMLIALLPLRRHVPLARVSEAMHNAPIVSTFLVALGWLPLFWGVSFIVAMIVAFIAIAMNIDMALWLQPMMITFVYVEIARRALMGLILALALVWVFVFRKTVAGSLDKHFKLM